MIESLRETNSGVKLLKAISQTDNVPKQSDINIYGSLELRQLNLHT